MGAKRFQTKKRLAGRQFLHTCHFCFDLSVVLYMPYMAKYLSQIVYVLSLPRVHSGRISSTPCWTLRVARRSACPTCWTWQRGAGRPSRRGRGCRRAWTRQGSSWSGGLHSQGGELCNKGLLITSMGIVSTNNNHGLWNISSQHPMTNSL